MLTLIIPVRDWPDRRIELCVESFLSLAAQSLTEILIVDFGSSRPVRLGGRRALPRGVSLLRVEADVWSLAEAINVGVAAARNEVVAKTDADILIAPQSRGAFDRVAERIHAGLLGLSMTQAIDLDASIGPDAAAEAVAEGGEGLGRLRARWGQGGLVMFSRANWNRIGGFDSRFTGWGNEDNDFAERMRLSGERVEWTDREALRIYHVWHPPSFAATGVLSQRLSNQRIAKNDRSVFRPIAFRNSNFARIAAPQVMSRLSPHVTIAIATAARPHRDRMIVEAINSFRGQLDDDSEIVVVDNGSSPDETAALRRRLARLKLRDRLVFEVMEEGSIPAARNLISRLARGRYICVADDDDIALPNRLYDHLKAFEADGLAHGSHGGWIDFDETTGVIERNSGKQRGIATMLKGTGKITAHPASLYRTDVMRAIPYDEAFALGSDFDLAMRMANMGFDIRHTNTYLTLRRFHAANVTITGQSNQVSNGALARSRTLASFTWNRHRAIEEEAKKVDDPVYCRNQMSIDTLAALIPGYSGTWQVYVPITALSPAPPAGRVLEAGAALLDQLQPRSSARAGESVPAIRKSEVAAASAGVATVGNMDAKLLSAVLDIIDGEIVTRRSGLNMPVFFRSVPISSLDKARRIEAAIENLVKVPVNLNSVRHGEIDRQVPFDWRALAVKPGERVLQSERFSNLADALVVFSRIDQATLLRKAVSILADFDGEGEAYYLVTPAVRGHDQLRALQFDLERHTELRFRQLAANGVPSELTLSDRAG